MHWLTLQQHDTQRRLAALVHDYLIKRMSEEKTKKRNGLMRMPKAPPKCHMIVTSLPSLCHFWEYHRETGWTIEQESAHATDT
jgi:hypothetical protein